ncbi:hypothetical protein [Paenibacillus piri]|uniref:Uncharacterized protein n=1 Tax=Paenibacillus piri TaxID=2547395 RepID=A0A4R5KGJ4_9BACL|nr:hypothetical protein [Paenibacillus piri]TDF94511.1 hypothetical protein E1757_24240 [Paenibacillus piri]
MKRNQLVAGLILVPLLLSGCGSKPAANEAAAANTQGSSSAASAQSGDAQAGGRQARGDRPQMNENEIRLRMLSQSLLAIDKGEGLAFTKQQAEQLLPLAEAAVAKKELTAEQQDSMLKLLTPEQTKQYQSRSDQMKQRMNPSDGGAPKTMTQEERDKQKEQRAAQGGGQGQNRPNGAGRGGENGSSGSADGSVAGSAGKSANGGVNEGAKGAPGGARGGGPGADVAQQLVDLFKERAK